MLSGLYKLCTYIKCIHINPLSDMYCKIPFVHKQVIVNRALRITTFIKVIEALLNELFNFYR